MQVPGSFELPYAASRMILSQRVDAVVCIGLLVKGSTMHFEYICEAVSQVCVWSSRVSIAQHFVSINRVSCD